MQDKITGIKLFSGTRNLILFLFTLLFLFLCLIMAGRQEYYIWFVPPALLIVALAFISVDRFFLLLLFLSPLSLQLRFIVPSVAFDMFLPTEPMLALLLLIVIYKLIASKEFDREFIAHPLTILVFISLAWMLVSSFTGTNLLVSLKYTLVRTWFVFGFYLLASELLKLKGFREKAIKALIFGMLPVIIYHMVNLASAGLFNRYAAHGATWPFFNDHTSFGAAIAFLIPSVLWFALRSKSPGRRTFYFVVFLVFICGLVFSYSRAAWISLLIAGLFSLVYFLRISWKIIGISMLAIGLMLVFSWSNIITRVESNSQDSSANLKEHVQSISNIRTDASNLERINRWRSALRMADERPLFGWGPGTYQFEYAPYQFSHERTEISTNFGDGGNAHSEFLGALAESGIPAPLIYILILILAFYSGHRAFKECRSLDDSYLALALMSGLMTYVVHGALNNFLDTDKISAPFWMFIACLLVMDLESGRKDQNKVAAIMDTSSNM